MSVKSTVSSGVSSEAERLARHLVRSRGTFSLVFVRWNHPGREGDVTARLRRLCDELKLLEVTLGGDPERLLDELDRACASETPPAALLVYGLQQAFPDFLHCREDDCPPILTVLNLQREQLRRRFPCALVLWLPEHALGLIARGAPDFWSWRSGIFDFELPAPTRREELAEIRRSVQPGPTVSREEIPTNVRRLLALWQDITAAGQVAPRERETAADIARQLLDLYRRSGEFALAEHWRDETLTLLEQLAADPDPTPVQRAGWQLEMGVLWNERPLGSPAENQSRAIRSYEAALQVYTEADFPRDWAGTLSNLGLAYTELPTEDRTVNLRRAIDFYEGALRVFSERDYPEEWAGVQNNLGIAYARLPSPDRGANVRRAIECFQAAVRVYTESEFPQDWAMTHNNLGGAYADLPSGDRADNLRRAIECYQAALRVYNEADFPEDWAMLEHNRGVVYRDLAEACDEPSARDEAQAALTRAERGFRNCGMDAEAAKAREALDALASHEQPGQVASE